MLNKGNKPLRDRNGKKVSDVNERISGSNDIINESHHPFSRFLGSNRLAEASNYISDE